MSSEKLLWTDFHQEIQRYFLLSTRIFTARKFGMVLVKNIQRYSKIIICLECLMLAISHWSNSKRWLLLALVTFFFWLWKVLKNY